jgi:tripartite-type tricarboxylate transporter receptor subunit TctC
MRAGLAGRAMCCRMSRRHDLPQTVAQKRRPWEDNMKHLALASALAAALLAPAAMAQISELKIMAPAGPGGGWDQTARTIQSTLQSEGLVSNIQVENVAGAGGTIGLQQFVNRSSGDPTATIVGGYVMVGAIIANSSPVTLADITPLARLTGEYVVVVAPPTARSTLGRGSGQRAARGCGR